MKVKVLCASAECDNLFPANWYEETTNLKEIIKKSIFS